MNLSFEQLTEKLLNRYECVILPEFGGFIVRESPCNFNASKDRIKPASKHIFFNPHLTANDGLLYNEIQTARTCTYNEAVEWYQSVVAEYKQVIEDAGSRQFGALGTFHKGKENNFWFSPAPELNLSLDSFGLSAVDIYKVAQAESEKETIVKTLKPETELADNKPIISTEPFRMNYKAWIAAATVALLVHFTYLKLETNDVTTNEASVLPTIESPVQEDAEANVDTTSYSTTSIDTAAEVLPETLVSNAAENPVIEPSAPVVVEPVVTESKKVESSKVAKVTPEPVIDPVETRVE
ncbi:MAG: hypothetical protein ACKOXF_07770, partial [Chitinophagaceae bacterium]